jgi:glycosyltransferase involved in cell wall biosynthesis
LPPLKILILCAKFDLPEQGPYLTNELAAALVRLGHQVQVAAVQWDEDEGPPLSYADEGVDIFRMPARTTRAFGRFVQLLYKWTMSSRAALPAVRRMLRGHRCDLMIAFAPLVTMHAPFRWAARHAAARTYVYVTDFFPFHHHSLGLIPGGAVLAAAHRAETALLRRADVIGCMTPANAAYLESHYRLRAEQRIEILGLWGTSTPAPTIDRAAVRRHFGLPIDRPIALFGGQITEGRGIETMLAAAALSASDPAGPVFLFVGAGRLAPLVRGHIERGGANVRLLDPLPRSRYLELAASADIGLIATVPDVDVPTFPSKTIDYLRAGLAVVASVEATTDYGEIIEAAGFGAAVPAGEPQALLGLLRTLLADPARLAVMREAGQRALHEMFDVDAAAATLLTQAGLGESGSDGRAAAGRMEA